MENFKEVLKERTGETEQIVYAYMPQETGYREGCYRSNELQPDSRGKTPASHARNGNSEIIRF